jgi:hypothetical protein
MAGSAHDAWQRVRLGNLENILCIVWHDASDDVVNVDESRSIVRYLQNLKYDVDYTETNDLGHIPSPQIVEDEYKKLRTRTRDLYPADVFIQSNSADTIFNRADWVQIYQPMSPGASRQRSSSPAAARACTSIKTAFASPPRSPIRTRFKLNVRNVRLRAAIPERADGRSRIIPFRFWINGMSRFNAIVPPQHG